MRSVAELKKKLILATAQGKDHRRSAMIRAMRTRLREQVGRPFESASKHMLVLPKTQSMIHSLYV